MLINIIFFIGEIFIIFSYLSRKIFLLRIGAVIGMGTYALGALVGGLHEKGMISIFIFAIVTFSINLYEIIKIFIDKKPIHLEENLKKIYDNHFNNLTQKEFFKVYQNLEIKLFKKDEILSVENEMLENIYFIKSGTVNIFKNNILVKELEAGFLLVSLVFLKRI